MNVYHGYTTQNRSYGFKVSKSLKAPAPVYCFKKPSSENFQTFYYITYICNNSTTNTAPQADSATVNKLFSLNARKTATIHPTAADKTLPVDVKIAGKVMAPSTA